MSAEVVAELVVFWIPLGCVWISLCFCLSGSHSKSFMWHRRWTKLQTLYFSTIRAMYHAGTSNMQTFLRRDTNESSFCIFWWKLFSCHYTFPTVLTLNFDSAPNQQDLRRFFDSAGPTQAQYLHNTYQYITRYMPIRVCGAKFVCCTDLVLVCIWYVS